MNYQSDYEKENSIVRNFLVQKKEEEDKEERKKEKRQKKEKAQGSQITPLCSAVNTTLP